MNQQTYLKVPFVWEEPKPLIEVPSQLMFCDTDANNAPMISIFQQVGYKQYGEPWKRPL